MPGVRKGQEATLDRGEVRATSHRREARPRGRRGWWATSDRGEARKGGRRGEARGQKRPGQLRTEEKRGQRLGKAMQGAGKARGHSRTEEK